MINLLPVAAVVLLLLGAPLATAAYRYRSSLRVLARRAVASPSSRCLTAVLVSAGICTAIQLFFFVLLGGGTSFAAFGAMKKVTLPLVYLVFALALVIPGPEDGTATPMPRWWPVLFCSLLTSAALGLVVGRQPLSLGNWAQGFLLLGGWLLFGALGSQSGAVTPGEQRAFAVALGGVAVLEAAMDESVGVFISIAYAVCAAGIYVAFRWRRWFLGIACLGLVVFMAQRLFADIFGSSAVKGQLAVSLALIVLLLMPVRVRVALLAAAAVGLLALRPGGQLIYLMTGNYMGIDDVTLSHRGYETHQVLSLMHQDPLTWWFGLGPSGTVDLSASPDFDTLLSSGRLLAAVDDVHFLTSWILLKLGVVGLLVFAFVFVSGARECGRVILQSRPHPFDVLLVLLFVTGVVMAIPAATMLFATPLPALSLGLLYARRISTASAGSSFIVPADLRV